MNLTETNNYQAKICVLLQENVYISKVTRPLIEAHITAVVIIPPELHTFKTVILNSWVFSCHFNLMPF